MTHGELIEQSVGSFRRWQLCVCLAVYLVNIPLAWVELAIIFLAPVHNFTCADNRTIDVCSCTNYEFQNSVFKETIVSQWNLVCDNDWLTNLAQTILMLGILVGNVAFGFFSDRYGRRKPLIGAAVMQFIAGVSVTFAPWFWLFIFLRFLVAVAAGGTQLTAFVISVEIVGRKHRSIVGVLFQITYYIGHISLGGIAYFLRDWHHLQLATSVPTVLLISYYWILPESPRWLLTVGRLEEAITVMEKGARINGLPTDQIRYNVISRLADEELRNENVVDLMRNPNVRTKTICICFNWMVLGLSFFGVAQYMGHAGGDTFLNVVICGLIQIPGNVFIIYLIRKCGRKCLIIISYLVCAVACLLITVVPSEPYWVTPLLGSIGMMGISLSFAIMFVFSGELYPTVVRNAGLGTSSMFAKFGSMVAPFVDGLSNYRAWIPPLIFGVGPLLAILVTLKLPETLNQKIPDTIAEAELIGKKVSIHVPPSAGN